MLSFGIPSKRGPAKLEKYPETAVLTIESAPVEKGMSSKLSLNPKAIELLNLNLDENKQFISFAFSNDGVYIINSTEMADIILEKDRYHVRKNRTVSNAKLYKHLTSIVNIGDYQLVTSHHDDAYQLSPMAEQQENGALSSTETTFEAPAELIV